MAYRRGQVSKFIFITFSGCLLIFQSLLPQFGYVSVAPFNSATKCGQNLISLGSSKTVFRSAEVNITSSSLSLDSWSAFASDLDIFLFL